MSRVTSFRPFHPADMLRARVFAALLLAVMLVLSGAVLSGTARADTQMRAAVPAWADDLPDVAALAQPDAKSARGTVWLLLDDQFAWPGGKRQTWEREVRQILSDEAIQEAAFQIFDYNRAMEDFAVTRVTVWRDGKETDLLGEVSLSSAPAEWGAETSRSMTVVMDIPGLRIGDILDIAVLRSALGQPAGLDRTATVIMEYQDPVFLRRAVVNWPEGWERHVKPLPDRVTLAEGPLPDGGTRLEYQLFDNVEALSEPDVPAWIDQRAVLRISADKDWQQVVSVLAPVYRKDWPLGKWRDLPELDALSGEAKVIAAMDLVAGDIAEASVTGSGNPALPRPPASVIASGEGEPSERALVLATLLRDQGFEADIALTSATYGFGLDRVQPSLSYLDHAVVRLRLEGKTYFLDPMPGFKIGSLTTMTPLDYGFVLPLVEGEGLHKIDADPAAIWSSDLRETWRFTLAGAYVDVVSELRGEAAEDLRYRQHFYGDEEVAQELLDYFSALYPGLVQVRPPEIQDDPKANVIHLYERYFISSEVLRNGGFLAEFPVATDDFTADLPKDNGWDPDPALRKFPANGVAPGKFSHRIELRNLPRPLDPPRPLLLENDAFRYRLEGSVPDERSLVLQWDFVAYGTEIPAAALRRVLRDADQVGNSTWFTFYLGE